MKYTLKNNILHKYEKEESILRMIPGGAWTINLQKWNLDDGISGIIYETTDRIYKISTTEAVAHGKIGYLGGEKKLIVPLKYWTIEPKTLK